MEDMVFKENILLRIKEIHKLSLQYNGHKDISHEGKLLELMKKHIDEIECLKNKGNAHYLIETGDLIILCFELLLENKKSIDNTILECFNRYENKLNNLIRDSV